MLYALNNNTKLYTNYVQCQSSSLLVL